MCYSRKDLDALIAVVSAAEKWQKYSNEETAKDLEGAIDSLDNWSAALEIHGDKLLVEVLAYRKAKERNG